MERTTGLNTLMIGAGEDPDGPDIAPALHQTVPFAARDASHLAALADGFEPSWFYRRNGNPTTARLESLVAAAEGAEAGLASASGMGSISCAILALTSKGDHVVAQRSLYSGTLGLLRDLGDRFGVDVTYVDQTDEAAFAEAITERTKLVVLETPSNPLLRLTDLTAVSTMARERGALTLVDNTIVTPANQQPLLHGVDLVVHSVTKALGGHADVQAGVVLGRADLVDELRSAQVRFGAVASPFDAWLALRGLRTLGLRVRQQNDNAQAVADYLVDRPEVRAVHYPGLPSHPQHELATRQMSGFGGLLSFELDSDDPAVADAFLDALRVPAIAPSLGAPRTLVVRPALMWARDLDGEQQAAAGIAPGLIRVALGLEDARDLVVDVESALSRIGEKLGGHRSSRGQAARSTGRDSG